MTNNFQQTTKSRTCSFSRTMPLKTAERLSFLLGNGGASPTTVASGLLDVAKLL